MTSTGPTIAVFGSSTARPEGSEWRLAYDLGAALGRAGATVMTGGYGGTMEACSRGAHEAGGHVVGVTVELFEARGPVNPFVRERVHAADLFERLRTLMERAEGFAVLPGSLGTLTELFLAWTLLSVKARAEAPLVLVGDAWREVLAAHCRPCHVPEDLFRHVQYAATGEEAARLVLGPLGARRS